MSDLFRETAFGGLLRLLSSNPLLQYPEERSDFVIPTRYFPRNKKDDSGTSTPTNPVEIPVEIISEAPIEPSLVDVEKAAPEREAGLKSSDTTLCGDALDNRTRTDNLVDCELTATALISNKAVANLLSSSRLQGYDESDPANPQNWSFMKRGIVTGIISYAY